MEKRNPRGKAPDPPKKQLVFGEHTLCPACKGSGLKRKNICGRCEGRGYNRE